MDQAKSLFYTSNGTVNTKQQSFIIRDLRTVNDRCIISNRAISNLIIDCYIRQYYMHAMVMYTSTNTYIHVTLSHLILRDEMLQN